MKKKLLLIASISLFVGVVFFPQIRLGTITALFLWDLLDDGTVHQPDHGTLAWVTPSPVVERLQISRGEEKIPADLYRLPDGKRRAGSGAKRHEVLSHPFQ